MQNFGMSMLWFWICYFLVTLVGILHTVFNIYVLHTKPMDAHSMGDGYEKNKPWHPLYHIILFSLFGYLYLNVPHLLWGRHCSQAQSGRESALYSMYLAGSSSGIPGA